VNIRINCTSSENRRTVLPDAENHTIISSSFWKKIPERDERTDGQTESIWLLGLYSALHCQQCGRAVNSHSYPLQLLQLRKGRPLANMNEANHRNSQKYSLRLFPLPIPEKNGPRKLLWLCIIST